MEAARAVAAGLGAFSEVKPVVMSIMLRIFPFLLSATLLRLNFN
jgi:hypothetical protein